MPMSDETQIAVMANDIKYIKEAVSSIKDEVHEYKAETERNFVTKAEFMPVQRLVYGLVSIVLSSVIIAIVALVLAK